MPTDRDTLAGRLLALAEVYPESADDLRLAAELADRDRIREAIIAVAEMRGWAWAETGKKRNWLFERIDKLEAAFAVGDYLKQLAAEVIEGRRFGGREQP